MAANTSVTLVLTVAVVLSELRSISFARDEVGKVTLSTTSAFALLLAAGTAPAVLVLGAASMVGDLLQRKPLQRTVFNVGQYALALGAAGVVASSLTGRAALLAQPQLDASGFAALLAAAATFYVVNTVLTDAVLALRQHLSLLSVLRHDVAVHAFTTGVLLALAPAVVVVASVNAGLLTLLVLPVIAVYRSARASMEKDHLASHDALTELPNRRLFLERLAGELRNAGTQEQVAVLIIDLDRFKEVNDALGHHMGDRLLQVIGADLQRAAGADALAARLGGDEFAMVLPQVDGADDAVRMAKAILQRLTSPIEIDGFTVDIGASLGIALYPEHGSDVSTVMQHADVAMYLAKDTQGGYEVYSPERDPQWRQRVTSAAELRGAVENGQLVLHYQPKADMRSGLVDGVEALVRWDHPEHGMVPPAEFIPLAERAGLVGVVTTFVLDTALEQCKLWRDEGLDLQVAVNVSVQSLYDHRFPEMVEQMLLRWSVPPERIILEVTENTVMADLRRATRVLAELSAMGVTLAIDDFGTGASSLASLQQLPVSELKIDNAFVLGMATDSADATIVHSAIDLGRRFGLSVVAEGVESQRVWQLLARLGCDQAQGYHISRPLPADELTPWLHDNLRLATDGDIVHLPRATTRTAV
ncbi:MAG: EAL domain-containing protein [Actinomycetota bacterium]|nr:EAL domain-containing protein [Actinomycetota bacterium]